MTSILITTWGDPRQWEEVTYIIDERRYSRKTKSSLPAIVDYTYPKPEKVLLIVLDTIVKSPFSSYGELKYSVMKYYQDFLNTLNIEVPVEVIIAPGAGKFKLNDGRYVEFHGSLTDFHAYVTFEIARRLAQVHKGDLTVHLDLSHGVNFMPSLTYASVSEVLGALAVARKVYLRVYNAEPFIRGVTSELNIHTVEDRELSANLKPEALPPNSSLLEPRTVDKRERVNVESRISDVKINKAIIDELNGFLSSLINGLPLAYYSFYPDVNNLEQLLNKAVELWLSNMKITVGDGNIVVERDTRFRGEFISCTIIWTVARALNDGKKTEVKLEELENLRRKVFHRWAKLNSMISYDLEEIEKDVYKSGLELNNWTVLDQIIEKPYGGVRTRSKTSVPEAKLIRNFLAHSGLERRLIYVKRAFGEIQLCYDLKKRRDMIIKACVKGLCERGR